MTMGRPASLVAMAVIFAGAVGTASAQTPPMANSFRYGSGYDFEVTTATRPVDDAHDRGSITLTVYVWRPLHTQSRKVAFFSHGSTGGGSIHPKEPIEFIPRPLIRYFVDRGYTVVMPMRRGLGSSTGTFFAECQFQSGQCSLADNRALASPSLEDAVADNSAVLDQVVLGRILPRDGKVLFTGISRGGLLSLRMASTRPENTAGALNFVGGWISMSDVWPADELEARREWHRQQLQEMARGIRVPTLWIYGSRDPFYSEVITRSLFDSYLQSGGKGQYLLIGNHTLPSGHNVGQAPELWERDVNSYLASIE